jgi:hypothetical protein
VSSCTPSSTPSLPRSSRTSPPFVSKPPSPEKSSKP